jgi:hypothetical protein
VRNSSSADLARAERAWRDRLQIGGEAHDQLGKPLRKLWRAIRSRLPSPLGAALLPQSLQGQLSCKNRQGMRAHKKVARLSVLGGHQIALALALVRLFHGPDKSDQVFDLIGAP